MIHTLTRAALVLLMALVSVGCDSGGDDDDPPPPVEVQLLQGSYDGTANVGGLAVTLELTLAENMNTVSGSGTLRGSEVLSLSVSGTRVNNNFNLTLSNNNFEDLNFAGTVNGSGSVITGDLNGSGFNNVSITLNRTGLTGGNPASLGAAEGDGAMLDVIR